MSYNISVVGRDKAKLKAAIREQQSKDEVKADGSVNPYPSGIPSFVADRLCSEIDRVRIYEYNGRTYGLLVKAQGSHHEQGGNDSMEITAVQAPE